MAQTWCGADRLTAAGSLALDNWGEHGRGGGAETGFVGPDLLVLESG